MDEFDKFENLIVNGLEESGLIERFSVYSAKPSPNLEVIIKLFKEPLEIFCDELGLFYIENGDKMYCPEVFQTIQEKGFWISDKLPPVNFDIDMSGNVRKAEEAEALYCCACISKILKENEFEDEFMKISKNYDFVGMKSNDDSHSFRSLLNSWLDLQSVIINVITSACRYKLSEQKKDTEKFLRDGLSSLEVEELRDLESKIRAINFRYSDGSLSPANIKLLNKIERLKIIDERDSEIIENIKNSKVGMLYRLLNLSTEYISPVSKKRISNYVQIEVDKLLTSDKYVNSELAKDRTNLISKLTKKAYKFERSSIRKKQVDKYIQLKDKFVFPSKL
jgi:hypothetical protein